MTVLTPIAIARKQEGVGHLATKPAGHVDELDEPDDGRTRQRDPLAAEYVHSLRLDNLGLAVDDESKRTSYGNHCERFKRGIQG
jgi:hypothetical protein